MWKAENKNYIAECTNEGIISVREKVTDNVILFENIFPEGFSWRYEEWSVEPQLYLPDNRDTLTVAYGIGYLYFIDLPIQRVIFICKLFSEVCYENESYMQIDTSCYYNEITRVDFSPSEKYITVRVRGDYDPQEADGKDADDLFIPVYFRTVFVIDTETYAVVFRFTEPDRKEHSDLASVAYSPDEKFLVTGALGGNVRMFHLKTAKQIFASGDMAWIPDPLGIKNRSLIAWVENDRFVYVNKKYNLAFVGNERNAWSICTVRDVHTFSEAGTLGYIKDIYAVGDRLMITQINRYNERPWAREVSYSITTR